MRCDAPPSLPTYPANESTETRVRGRVLRTVPERYLFRIGMVPSCCLIIYVWYLVLEWVRGEEKIMAPVKGSAAAESHYTKEGVAAALGTIGAMLLIIASSVIEEGQMPWCVEASLPLFVHSLAHSRAVHRNVHIIGATGFFIFTGIAQLILTTKLYQVRLPPLAALALARPHHVCALAVCACADEHAELAGTQQRIAQLEDLVHRRRVIDCDRRGGRRDPDAHRPPGPQQLGQRLRVDARGLCDRLLHVVLVGLGRQDLPDHRGGRPAAGIARATVVAGAA